MPSDFRTASQGAIPFIAGAYALAVLYTGNNLPSALYGVFRAEFVFSPLTQTLLYATAVAVILPGLLIAGPLSDSIGRRAPMLIGLTVFAFGDLLFALAHNVGWLFAARVAQGIGMGTATAAAQTTLYDNAGLNDGATGDPVHAQRRAATTATACITFGLAFGPLLGGVLVQYAPVRLAFLVHLVLVVIAATLTLRAPGQPAEHRPWRAGRLAVPVVVRRTFAIAGASSFAAWAVLGVFSAVLPSLIGELARTSNLAITAGALTLMIGTSGVVQLVARGFDAVRAQAVGLAALAVGLILLSIAITTHSQWCTVLAMLCTGTGHGLIYYGALRELAIATPAADRGTVTAAYFFVSYLGLGGPVILVGLLAVGSGLPAATHLAAVVISVLCVLLIPLVFTEIRRRTYRKRASIEETDSREFLSSAPGPPAVAGHLRRVGGVTPVPGRSPQILPSEEAEPNSSAQNRRKRLAWYRLVSCRGHTSD
jgi:MFS family permease